MYRCSLVNVAGIWQWRPSPMLFFVKGGVCVCVLLGGSASVNIGVNNSIQAGRRNVSPLLRFLSTSPLDFLTNRM